jgi:hypothetical protein
LKGHALLSADEAKTFTNPKAVIFAIDEVVTEANFGHVHSYRSLEHL